ncbi:hypothetical protein J3A83DRAFT_4409388 [Scleroderma citrinum]
MVPGAFHSYPSWLELHGLISSLVVDSSFLFLIDVSSLCVQSVAWTLRVSHLSPWLLTTAGRDLSLPRRRFDWRISEGRFLGQVDGLDGIAGCTVLTRVESALPLLAVPSPLSIVISCFIITALDSSKDDRLTSTMQDFDWHVLQPEYIGISDANPFHGLLDPGSLSCAKAANIVLSVMLCTFVHLLDMFVGFLVLIGTSVCCLAPSSRSYALVLPTLRLSESFTSPLAHIVHSPATFVTPLTTRVAYLLYQSYLFTCGSDVERKLTESSEAGRKCVYELEGEDLERNLQELREKEQKRLWDGVFAQKTKKEWGKAESKRNLGYNRLSLRERL